MPGSLTPTSRRVAAVERAAAALFALAEAGELGTNELARRLGTNASTASRLLATLAASDLVETTPGGRYRLGLGALRLGLAVRLDLRGAAQRDLLLLGQATGETVTLSAPGHPDAFTVSFLQSSSSVQSVAQVGRPSIAHATAVGKVLLAFGDRPSPEPPLERFTSKTIVDPDALAAEVARVREQGYGEALGEREPDLNAIAAPVFGAGRQLVAILGVQGPASRFDPGAMQAAVPVLLERAAGLSAVLGGR